MSQIKLVFTIHYARIRLKSTVIIKYFIYIPGRAPMYTHLTQSIQGLAIIRTFNVEEKFKTDFDMYQNIHSSAFFMFLGAARTYGFWLDMLAVVYVGLVVFFLLIVKKGETIQILSTILFNDFSRNFRRKHWFGSNSSDVADASSSTRYAPMGRIRKSNDFSRKNPRIY